MVSSLSSSLSLDSLLISRKPRSATGNQVRSRLASSFRVFSVLEINQRRSASYHPTVWETKYIQSFVTPYSYKLHENRLEELKRIARWSLTTTKDPRSLLNLIDSMQRLGVAYLFEDEITEAISLVSQDVSIIDDLNMTALKFRILREHGVFVSPDVFNRFRDKSGRFMDGLCSDVRGLLSLYEASHLGMPEEDVLVEAKNFTARHLKYSLDYIKESYLSKHVQQSLEVPLHWRMPRLEARNFIDLYELNDEKNLTLLELAKLDYNLVQSVYQDELKDLACWWRDLGFKENLDFARDRLMENYLWAMGIVYEPRLSKCRVGLTKFVCILTAIDDVYDVYGSPDELEAFTNAVERWDIEAMSDLPLYMKICYLAMVNFGNEVIYDVLKNHGLDVSSFIKEEWLNLCRSYLVEARWFCSGQTPTTDQYLQNACTSVGGHAAIAHAFILSLDCSVPKETLTFCFDKGSNFIHWSSLVTRLSDDLGTSKDEIERGDVAKSVECYMKERNICEEESLKRIKEMIVHSWKMMSKDMINYNSIGLPRSMVKMCLNMARTAQCIFQHGDGVGKSGGITKDRLVSLIVKPVSI